MPKLIELSVSGSRYYFLESLSVDQIENLTKLARAFRSTDIICASESDDAYVQEFIHQARLHLGLHLKLIDVDKVLVIK